jgi:hypothetical protein
MHETAPGFIHWLGFAGLALAAPGEPIATYCK